MVCPKRSRLNYKLPTKNVGLSTQLAPGLPHPAHHTVSTLPLQRQRHDERTADFLQTALPKNAVYRLPKRRWVLLEKLSSSASQEILRILWNSKVHYRIHNNPSPVPILRQINLVHALRHTSWRHILILSSHLLLGPPSDLFPSNLPTKIMYAPLLSPIRAPSHYFKRLVSYIQNRHWCSPIFFFCNYRESLDRRMSVKILKRWTELIWLDSYYNSLLYRPSYK